ncbi:MAG: oligosaccharide flippase family protein [candidate division KSB1 bacterium]|nr:oligosaccharide flippase family protein [candidate division KSB1 bacterium]MDZ7369417.1 oligosaccharide flippase family protein [candidate division KSB1 bacterium]MDZ7407506.1 oligosaccharide flippase family protein [candidate division KSB1 bacterium]
MFTSIKRLTSHSAVYGISTILGRAISFLLLPLYTHFLSEADYGVVTIVLAWLGIMTIISTYGVDAAFLRYYILTDRQEDKRNIFNTGFWSIVLMSGGILVFSILLAGPLANWMLDSAGYRHIIILMAGILLFDSMSIIPFLLLRAEERSGLYVTLRVANVIVNFLTTFFFVVKLGRGVTGVFEANLISSVFTFLTLLPVTRRHFRPTMRRAVYADLLKFGLPYLPSTLSVFLIDVIDRFILKQLTDLDTVGLYGAGCKLGMLMNLLIAAFRFAWHPFFLSTSKEPNAKAIFSRVFTLFLLVCAVCFLGASLFIDELVRLRLGSFTLFGKAYWNSTSVVPAILLAYIFFGAYVNFIIGIYLENKTSALPFITGLSLGVKIAATYALVPLLGMNGAALGTTLAYLSMAVALYFVAQRLYYITYEWRRVVKLIFATAAVFILGYWVWPAPWQKAVLLAAFPVALFLIGFFEKGEVKRMSAIFQKGEVQLQARSERQTSSIKDEL